MKKILAVVCCASILFAGQTVLRSEQNRETSPAVRVTTTAMLDQQVRSFLTQEITAHVADIKALDPPPDRVVGALTIGEFSWGTFMRTLGDYSIFASTNSIAGHDVPQMIGKMAQIELSRGGKTWAQLYAAMGLRSFGKDLNHNTLWQSLSLEEKKTYCALLDPTRFYDAKTHTLIHLPENYFGVAARIAAISYDLGLNKDRASLDDLLNRAAAQFTAGALYADDALPTGRYDRYSNEYARAIYDAAQMAGREDIVKAVSPSLKEQMALWWDLLSADGYGYQWGRSLGAISYMDTMEIVGFVGVHPEFRPAPMPQLAAAYNAAWTWLQNDFNKETHLLNVFGFGRGEYGYITKEREWQQTTTFFAKVMSAHKQFIQTMTSEKIEQFNPQPTFENVARFKFFKDGGGRKFGVWIVRQGDLHFALPFVVGPKAATSDYEPVPFGFANIAAPVEKIYPCMVPFLELEDGGTFAAVDGADEIKPASDGLSVSATWKRWVTVGGKAGELQNIGLTTEVTWMLHEQTLTRSETVSASKSIKLRKLWMAVPSRGSHLQTIENNGKRVDQIAGEPGALQIVVKRSDWPLQISAFASGDSPLGRSDRGPIPLHLILESHDISFAPNTSKKWEIEFAAKP